MTRDKCLELIEQTAIDEQLTLQTGLIKAQKEASSTHKAQG